MRTLSNVLEMLPIIHGTDSAFDGVSSPRLREELVAEPRDRSLTPEPQFFPGLCEVPCSHTARAFQCSCAYTSVPDCLCSRVCLCVFMCVRVRPTGVMMLTAQISSPMPDSNRTPPAIFPDTA